jgi:glyoxylase-like metal-dependent hydrolase (beta-lactamase superfamily II)
MEPQAIDVRHLGRDRVICCWRVGDVLVDPGPESCAETLVESLGGKRPRALLLTHVHLDHAGAAGTLVRRWPELEVHVHESGAPHLADPSKLLESASRLYGDEMERLWGEVVPVPEENLRPLRGGEILEGSIEVARTPGHARHHVSYFDERSHIAYVGDMAGVRLPPYEYTLAPTPPPDIDLDAWFESLDVIRAWRPVALCLTHFGQVHRAAEQLERLEGALRHWAGLARGADAESWIGAIEREIDVTLDPDTAERFEQALPPDQSWVGLERYWKKRAEAGAATAVAEPR